MPVRWVFGDGSVAYGQNVTHTYEYPGEYVAVIAINAIEEKISARVNVSISEDSVSIIEANNNRIVVHNNGKKEVYLYGKMIVSSGSHFDFPEDTIIKPGQKISFSNKITGLKVSSIPASIKNSGYVRAENEPFAMNEEEKQKVIDQIIVLQNKQIEIKKSNDTQLASIGAVVPFEEATTTAAVKKKDFMKKIKAFFRLK